MKHKNWSLFKWAFTRLELDRKNNNTVYKRCFKNGILLKLMDLSGVTPDDLTHMLTAIENELKRRGEL